ncbi:MAG: FGGY family carbohydrate kinase [Candidatus Limivivens sp.]|nr:FGGY family carbohydrate kinase [Candidatus Limivivens sp.]
MNGIGIDIGTTTVSFLALEAETGRVLESRTVLNDTWIRTENPLEKIQDPDRITKIVQEQLSVMLRQYQPAGIGISCQMHGFLYTDREGRARSPFYTWQDGRGRESARILSRQLHVPVSEGYGLATHLFLLEKGLVPENAAQMVTIGDYVGQRLCKEAAGPVSAGNAASWGGFDAARGRFRREELEGCGIDPSVLPEIAGDFQCIGVLEGHIPVAAAIGDNQASFLGSVPDGTRTVLVNVGTGSQVSVGMPGMAGNGIPGKKEAETAGTERETERETETETAESPEIEFRPCLNTLTLCVGSALCGGRAYALLEEFFREVLKMADAPERCVENLYEKMAASMEGLDSGKAPVLNPAFSGSRSDPFLRASIRGLTPENFTPGYLTYGMLEGVAEELNTLYRQMPLKGLKPVYLAGAGNGIRKNPVLQRILEEKFRMPLQIPVHREEAAYGAALYGLCAAGVLKDIREGQNKIRFQDASEKKPR